MYKNDKEEYSQMKKIRAILYNKITGKKHKEELMKIHD